MLDFTVLYSLKCQSLLKRSTLGPESGLRGKLADTNHSPPLPFEQQRPKNCARYTTKCCTEDQLRVVLATAVHAVVVAIGRACEGPSRSGTKEEPNDPPATLGARPRLTSR